MKDRALCTKKIKRDLGSLTTKLPWKIALFLVWKFYFFSYKQINPQKSRHFFGAVLVPQQELYSRICKAATSIISVKSRAECVFGNSSNLRKIYFSCICNWNIRKKVCSDEYSVQSEFTFHGLKNVYKPPNFHPVSAHSVGCVSGCSRMCSD